MTEKRKKSLNHKQEVNKMTNLISFVMERLSDAREMRERQEQRFDEVEIVEDKVDGKNVWVVMCANN